MYRQTLTFSLEFLRILTYKLLWPSPRFGELHEALVQADPKERVQKLMKWEHASSARLAHPQEDHLLPLMVALGAAQEEECEVVYHENRFMGDITVSSFRFGAVKSQ